ncbi:hypothetical protein V1477_017168 [Vespula maculifrons]|uniref:Uncharacterized protein n=1 Tax=Vespula maculifrons TaxID=7453 RepID=A0ABD2B597_VESMC
MAHCLDRNVDKTKPSVKASPDPGFVSLRSLRKGKKVLHRCALQAEEEEEEEEEDEEEEEEEEEEDEEEEKEEEQVEKEAWKR